MARYIVEHSVICRMVVETDAKVAAEEEVVRVSTHKILQTLAGVDSGAEIRETRVRRVDEVQEVQPEGTTVVEQAEPLALLAKEPDGDPGD
jgi:beta-lactamase class D